MQLAPFFPQLVAEGAWQSPLPSQHPVGHEALSQTQLPPTQRLPAPQAAPLPHLHCPEVQLSAVVPQSTQAPPLVPQALGEGVVHVLPVQHPEVHDI